MAKETERTKNAVHCPNCQGPAIKEGNVIICEACDATFTISRTAGARVKKMGRLDDIESRLERVEAKLPSDEQTDDEQTSDDEPTDNEPTDDDQGGEFLPR